MEQSANIKKWVLFCVLIIIFSFHPSFQCAKSHGAEEIPTLKIALLPIIDSLPFYVAEANGYFDQENIKVTPLVVASGLDRDQLMQAGEIDAMLNEMTTTASFNRHGNLVKIVGIARKAYADFPMFRVLSAPKSGLTTVHHLAGVPIGVSINTIIEYVTDRLLTSKGLSRKQIINRSVPVIPERYQLLLQGRLKAATLPDPLAESAIEAGAFQVISDSAHPKFSVSVLSFHTNAIKDKNAAVRAFMRAWYRGAKKINQDPGSCVSILLKKIRLPKNIRDSYRLPPYPLNRVPTPDQWADVMAWMVEKGLLERPLPYGDSVTAALLPEE